MTIYSRSIVMSLLCCRYEQHVMVQIAMRSSNTPQSSEILGRIVYIRVTSSPGRYSTTGRYPLWTDSTTQLPRMWSETQAEAKEVTCRYPCIRTYFRRYAIDLLLSLQASPAQITSGLDAGRDVGFGTPRHSSGGVSSASCNLCVVQNDHARSGGSSVMPALPPTSPYRLCLPYFPQKKCLSTRLPFSGCGTLRGSSVELFDEHAVINGLRRKHKIQRTERGDIVSWTECDSTMMIARC